MAITNTSRQLLSSIRQLSSHRCTSLDKSARFLSTTPVRQTSDAQNKLLGSHLRDSDPQIYEILQNEKKRQRHFINLIPSENFTSLAVLEALGSVMQSKLLDPEHENIG